VMNNAEAREKVPPPNKKRPACGRPLSLMFLIQLGRL
jgi:hypothetical protein